MVMALAGQWDVVDKLANGVDLYCDFASKLFGRTITKADKAERFLGKTAMLGLQYGAGAPRFQEMVRLAARQDPSVQEIDINRAYAIVDLYRQVHPEVVALWDRCQNVILPDVANGCSLINVDVNGWFITQKNGFGRPGEPGVVYHDLQYNPRSKEWTYLMGRQRVRIYGPKVVENLSQHAAMRVVMWQTARINEKYPVKLSVHDEAVTVPKTAEITQARAYMEECLSLAPKWCRDNLPLACETGVGASYGDAK
jgi:DNA polymerase